MVVQGSEGHIRRSASHTSSHSNRFNLPREQLDDASGDISEAESDGDSIMASVHGRISMLEQVSIALQFNGFATKTGRSSSTTHDSSNHREDDVEIGITKSEGLKVSSPAAQSGFCATKTKTWKRGSFRVSFQTSVTVPIALAMLVVCLSLIIPFSVVFADAMTKIWASYNKIIQEQRGMLKSIGQNANERAYHEVLKNIEFAIQRKVIAPADKAVDSIYEAMLADRFIHRVNVTTDSPYLSSDGGREWLGNLAWRVLIDQARDSSSVTAAGAYVALQNGAFAGAAQAADNPTASWDEVVDHTFIYSAPVGVPSKLSCWRADPLTGAPTELLTNETIDITTRPYFQAQQYFKHDEPLQSAWSIPHQFKTLYLGQAKTFWGLSRTRPVAFCGNYSCLIGVVAADVSLNGISATAQMEWEQLQQSLSSSPYNFNISAENSVLFIVNQQSQPSPIEEIHYIGASNGEWFQKIVPDDDGHSSFNLSQVNASGARLIDAAQKFVHHRFGGWNAPDITGSGVVLADFSLRASEFEMFASCAHEVPDDDCYRIGMHTVIIDENTNWTVVLVLPAAAFSAAIAEVSEKVDDTIIEEQGQSQKIRNQTRVTAIVLSVSVSLLSVCIGFVISNLVSKPLGRMRKLMKRLRILDFSRNTETHRSSIIAEVDELQADFALLSRSIETLAKFLPETVIRNIVRGDEHAKRLHVEQKNVTIMFSDVKDFTSIAEKLTQRELLTVLVMYLSCMTRIVEAYEGVVSEILGDGLLVFWNTPDDVEQHAMKACAAAVAQQEAILALNKHFVEMKLPELSIRIGLHTGDVLSGNIGSETKMKFGCLGDPMNLAARLEGLCKYYGCGILISGATFEQLPADTFVSRKLDLVQVKGKRKPIWVYELVGRNCADEDHQSSHTDEGRFEEHRSLTKAYDAALEAFHCANFRSCVSGCEAILQTVADVPSQRLLQRARMSMNRQQEELETWTPILEMMDK